MAILPIVIYGHPVLRMKTKSVEAIDDSIRTLVDDMIETMEVAEGIGLAAPQVAESVAVCVVNMGLFEDDAPAKAYVNLVILEEDDGAHTMEEGCLSIPDIREDVTRPEKIKIKYWDIEGQEHEEEVEGMLATVLQHEIDHLNGVMFIDKISSLKRKLLSKKLRNLAAEYKSGTYIPKPEGSKEVL